MLSVGALIVAASCVTLVSLLPADPAPYLATLDALPVPPSWQIVRTYAQREIFMGSRADRYYFVDADPADAVPSLKDAMRAAGFEIHVPVAPSDWCDPQPLDSIVVACAAKVIEPCSENGPGGPITCHVEGCRRIDADPQHLEDLFASLSPRGTVVDYGPGASPRYVSDPSRAVVVISASLTSPRHFWSSPTPPAGDGPSP